MSPPESGPRRPQTASTSADTAGADTGRVPGRRILELAVPALGVLAAEPLYLLFDTAVVGRLGAESLAGLAIGGIFLAQVSTQLTFLSYGTTSRSARLIGAGKRAEAVGEGVQATWLALMLGLLVIGAVRIVGRPIIDVLAGSGEIAQLADEWVRIAVWGVPLILVGLAGNGWMRGVQDTVRPLRYVLAGLALSAVLCPVLVHGLLGAPRLGLAGSAVANVAGQAVAATLFLRALAVESRSTSFLRPKWPVMKAQIVLGRDLVLRSMAFQACFLSAAAVAARFGAAAVGAHQVVLQLWNFVALTLDSLAIAAQTLIGAALGAGKTSGARALAWQITRWSVVFSALIALGFASATSVLPRLFTTDASVLAQIHVTWWFFVAMIPVAGVVFALDGVLLGSGDAAFLRTTTLTSALVGFLPLIWLSLIFDWGLAGIWTGLAAFMILRMSAVVVRTRSGRWAVPGERRERSRWRPPGE